MRGEGELDMKNHVADKILIISPFKNPLLEGVYWLSILNIIAILGRYVSI